MNSVFGVNNWKDLLPSTETGQREEEQHGGSSFVWDILSLKQVIMSRRSGPHRLRAVQESVK